MKRVIMGGVAAGLAALGIAGALAPTASANTGVSDLQYLSCLREGWGASSTNELASVYWGHEIAHDVSNGVSPYTERNYIYTHTDIPTVWEANVMVNCATSAYLGYGNGSTV